MLRSTVLLRRTLLPLCSCNPQLLAPILRPIISRGYAKKKENRSKAFKAEEDEPVQAMKAEKKGKGKGKSFVDDSSAENVGIYEIESIQSVMSDSVNKLRVSLKSVVGRVGRVSPGSFLCSAHSPC